MYSGIYFNYFCSELIMKTEICTQPPIRLAAGGSKFAGYFRQTHCLLFFGNYPSFYSNVRNIRKSKTEETLCDLKQIQSMVHSYWQEENFKK